MANVKKKGGSNSIEAKRRELRKLSAQISLEKKKKSEEKKKALLARRIEQMKKTLATLKSNKKK
ncbi:MAG: hypothetical protein MJZ19_08500 [Paludibacteraceae bacterium]|nr:hypothetical protein [Paludibacteraceae bacterium]